eukprot:759394-Hanusia_phi.AAC.4
MRDEMVQYLLMQDPMILDQVDLEGFSKNARASIAHLTKSVTSKETETSRTYVERFNSTQNN